MIKKQFRFHLRLERHLCFATVSHGIRSVDVEASYICEPLRDLVNALILLYKSPGWQRTVTWLVEPGQSRPDATSPTAPGQFRWLLDRYGEDVRIRILWSPHFSNRDDGELMFDSTAPLKRVATQISGQMKQLLNEGGLAGYHERWGRPFPHDQLGDLIDVIEKAG